MTELSPRQERVLEMREKDKMTYRQIGEEIGTGVDRARQIYVEAANQRERLSDPETPYRGLSTRAANILLSARHRIGTREKIGGMLCYKDLTRQDVRKAYEAGELRPLHYKDYGWHGCRGLGKKTLKELAAWAEFELRPRPKKKVKLCPHCGKEL